MGQKADLKLLREYIDNEKRVKHCLAVQKEAKKLAKRFGADEGKASYAGLMHDIGKNLSYEKQLKLIEKHGVVLSKADKIDLEVLHGTFSACILKENGITDADILQAVTYHTTGCKKMSKLSKIIYLADIIEPSRSFRGVGKLRKLCKKNLNDAMIYALRCTLISVLKRGKLIHPDSVKTYNHLVNKKIKTNFK